MKLSPIAKAVWAFLSSTVAALTLTVQAVPSHSLRDVGTLGWLVLAGSVLAITGGVYGFTNSPPAPPPAPPAPPA